MSSTCSTGNILKHYYFSDFFLISDGVLYFVFLSLKTYIRIAIHLRSNEFPNRKLAYDLYITICATY